MHKLDAWCCIFNENHCSYACNKLYNFIGVFSLFFYEITVHATDQDN